MRLAHCSPIIMARAVFQAGSHGSPDGVRTLESVRAALSAASGDAASAAGFACEDTLALATETIGFLARDTPATGETARR